MSQKKHERRLLDIAVQCNVLTIPKSILRRFVCTDIIRYLLVQIRTAVTSCVELLISELGLIKISINFTR